MSVPQTDALDRYATIAVLVSISKTVKYYTINLCFFTIFFHKNKKNSNHLNFDYRLAIAETSPIILITKITEIITPITKN